MNLSTDLYNLSFASNPMMVHVAIGNDFGDSTIFRQCKVIVTINGREYPYDSECNNGDIVSFDVSSAFRAQMEITSDIEDITYPIISGTIRAELIALPKGSSEVVTIKSDDFGWGTDTTFYAIRGGVSIADRKKFGTQYKAVENYAQNLSTKPNKIETRNIGDTIYKSSIDLSNRAINQSTETLNTEGFSADGEIYVEQNPLRREFVFINSLGVLESCSAISREAVSMAVGRNNENIISAPSYIPNRRVYVDVNESKDIYEMSSGNLEREWIYWWTFEFLRSSNIWMKSDEGEFIPVEVEPKDDETTIYDRSSTALHGVEFTVRIGI